MNSNEKLILDFYDSLKKGDWKRLSDFYAKNATFRDPIFISLNASQTCAMWTMMINKKDFQLDFQHINVYDEFLTADYTLTWTCEKTGKKVFNNIKSRFTFNKEGKIVQHSDIFDFYGFVKQTRGITGLLFGWTGLLRNRSRKAAMEKLNYFISEKSIVFD